tara:strand:- start:125 stop:394 length:270 start_codon:yes stop_codon:yes gene_type:complete
MDFFGLDLGGPTASSIAIHVIILLLVVVGIGFWDSKFDLNWKHGEENVTRIMVVRRMVWFLFIQVAISLVILAIFWVGCGYSVELQAGC